MELFSLVSQRQRQGLLQQDTNNAHRQEYYFPQA